MLANNPLNLYNTRNTCLINPNIILYYTFSLNSYEYLEYNQDQYYHYQLKNHTYIHVVQFSHIIKRKIFRNISKT